MISRRVGLPSRKLAPTPNCLGAAAASAVYSMSPSTPMRPSSPAVRSAVNHMSSSANRSEGRCTPGAHAPDMDLMIADSTRLQQQQQQPVG